MLDSPITRRALLKAGGALVVSFGFVPRVADAQAANTGAKTVSADEVGGFIAIDSGGQVTLYSGKVELGTGALTALTQIVAEELSVAFARVKAIQGDTMLTPDQGPTYASLSIQNGGMQIRRAGATAREALLEQAASRLGVARTELVARDGSVALRDGSRALTTPSCSAAASWR